MGHRPGIAALIAIGLLLGACGGDETTTTTQPTSGSAATTGASPTKETLVQTLRDLQAALEAGDDDRALTYLVPLPGMPPEEMPAMLASFLERGEISAAGIEILAKEGQFGTLTKVFRRFGAGWAERIGLDPAQCYALSGDDAQVAALWDGTAFKIFRLNDVGKDK